MTDSFIKNVRRAIEHLQQNRMVLLTDDHKRENEADLIACAEHVTEQQLNFMLKHGSGIICVSLDESRCQKLGLPPMIANHENNSLHKTPFTIAVDAAAGITTGVSVADRQRTLSLLANPNTTPQDLAKPGHVYPLCAHKNGVLGRTGHTEGGLDLMKLAKLNPASVICEAMDEHGAMLRGQALVDFAEKYDIPILSVADIIDYRLRFDNLILEQADAKLPTEHGDFNIRVVRDLFGNEHTLLYTDKIPTPCPVRIHSSCQTGDIFSSLRCDCGGQLKTTLNQFAQTGGVILYMQQEGRGIGLLEKIKAYQLQQNGHDTVEANLKLGHPADARNYSLCAQMLRTLNIENIILWSNNPEKALQLKKYGIEINKLKPMPSHCNHHNMNYLQTKKDKLGHLLLQPH